RQLLTESVLLAAGGGAIGLVLAAWAVPLLVAAAPDSIPRLHEVTLDARAVAFTSVVSIATGLLFGLVPAAKMSRGALNDALKEGGRTASAHGRTGRVFVAAEVGLSLVLLVAAALLVRSLARLQEVRPGFDPERLLTLRLSLPESRYTTFEQGDRFFADLTARLRAAPGVRGAAASLPRATGWRRRARRSSARRSRASTSRERTPSASACRSRRIRPCGTRSSASRATSSIAASTRRIGPSSTCRTASRSSRTG